MMKHFYRQAGVTLVELMIGMLVGLIVIGGVATVYIAVVQSSSETLKGSRLNQELGAVMEIMVNDIRRAGYWADVTSETMLDNPFMLVDASNNKYTAISVRDASTNAWAGDTGNDDCITYTYDSDKDGSLETSSDMEYFGFKRDVEDGVGVVKMRTACAGSSCTNGNAADCLQGTGGTWSAVTDKNTVDITTLNFDLAESKCINFTQDYADCYDVGHTLASGDLTTEIREVNITIEGKLVSDDGVKVRLEESVRVRNDLLEQEP